MISSLKERRTIRKYLNKDIDEQLLNELLETASPHDTKYASLQCRHNPRTGEQRKVSSGSFQSTHCNQRPCRINFLCRFQPIY